MRTRRRRPTILVLLLASMLVPIAAANDAIAVNVNARPDFDNDGYADLVIADAYATVDGAARAGGVHVLYGSAVGPRADGSDFFTQNARGIPNAAEPDDYFGYVWAAGDFDGDGFDDLAIAAPNEDVAGVVDAGLVVVLYGGRDGLGESTTQQFQQDTPGIPDANESGDRFGAYGMVAADFDSDHIDDLVVSAESEDIGEVVNAGALWVFEGSPAGLDAMRSTMLTKASRGIEGAPQVNEYWGYGALRAGDFDGDGYDDLLVTSPYSAIGQDPKAGAFWVLYGSDAGLSGDGSQVWHEDVHRVPGETSPSEFFAVAAAVGDFDGDGHDDVAAAAPYENIGGALRAGMVYVFHGGPGGLDTARLQQWSQDTKGILDTAEDDDYFGYSSLASGDFDGDSHDDLAIGVSNEDLDTVTDAGALAILYGTAAGLTASRNTLVTQDSEGVADSPESGDFLTEHGLAALDANGDGRDDLSVPVPYEELESQADAGAAHVLFGGAAGLTGAGSIFITHGSHGIAGHDAIGGHFALCCY